MSQSPATEADASRSIIRVEPPPGMRVRFISDLHYGHERCLAPPPQQLVETLGGIGMLVVVGDMAETRPCPWQERGQALRDELRRLCAERGIELVEISGNHDPDLPALLALFWQGRVAAMHGHAIYKEVAPWSWEYLRNKEACKELIARYADSDENLLSRLELSRAMSTRTRPIMRREGIKNRYLRSFLHCFWPPQRPMSIVWSWLTCGWRAERFIRRFLPKTETLILGHFHRYGHWTYGKRTILNTGAWFKHATPYAVDMQDGRVISYTKWGH
ncbi:MAG: hypothetical protein II349_02095 [Akkermansia sp.]|nr:hypothetical protein [Akkermansia sp.]